MEDMCDAIDSPTLSPLSDEQQRQLNQVLTTPQYPATGLGQRLSLRPPRRASSPGGEPGAEVAAPGGSLTILYGSQTGNAKGVASAIKAQAEARGLPVTLTSMADYKPKQLKKEPPAGGEHLREGSRPESAVDLFEQLKKGKVGKLEGLKFAVLGLGDALRVLLPDRQGFRCLLPRQGRAHP